MPLQLRSLLGEQGQLELSLVDVPMPVPGEHEVVVRVLAAPVNPSDLGFLLAGADPTSGTTSGSAERPVFTATVPPSALAAARARVGVSMPVGNEGAGVVVAAGSSAEAQALLGKTVGAFGGAMYAEYRSVPAAQCVALADGTSAIEGASSYINPVTALGMVETMRREGHTGLVHTAAASNLGQMLLRLCQKDQIPLVNVVRKPEQEALLRGLGAEHVCNSSSPTFLQDLTAALIASGATLAFDATGGGPLAGQIVSCMEAAINHGATEYSRYGSNVHKQVYVYGALDPRPLELARDYGLAWGVGGWLLTTFMRKIGADAARRLHERVAGELKTTFASTYTQHVSLREMLRHDVVCAYARQATGEKYLLVARD